ncbi:siderophore-interacting protein [Saccharopolyspora oryzae]|uniref:Siderophore-interacting protein n=1 Tax=Saccharopolyspora oryzae TaxID=2997343 RepID=A0ABT4V7S7_9PSEU|nr:siderophore-interacting protein [Saccharopolyspora oryzae]MDA3630010.1 siderophore-interacting protein [Saccharopolyspora oryzae]
MAGTQTAQLRPDYRLFPVDVTRVQRLGPSFVRITFSAECLRGFGAGGDDQRIKLVLPQPGRTVADFPDGPDWYQRWLAQPDEIRPTLRTYTVRAFRPSPSGPAELDVDFVLHGTTDGHGGPASNWAATARPGQQIGLLGPDRPGCGRPWGCEWAPPESASHLVLAGDETAVPAVAAIVENLPRCARGVVCLEVPEEMDRQDWAVPAGVDVRWFARCTGAPHGKLLEEGVAAALAELQPRCSPGSAELDDIDVDTEALWEVPAEDTAPSRLYGWLAGEAGVIKRLRRMLVSDYGIPKQSVAFMGYWREGRS